MAEPARRRGFDWPALMQAGLTGLRLRPEQFWALTPAELRLMLGTRTPRTMSRQRLDELLKLWPDDRMGREGVSADGEAG